MFMMVDNVRKINLKRSYKHDEKRLFENVLSLFLYCLLQQVIFIRSFRLEKKKKKKKKREREKECRSLKTKANHKKKKKPHKKQWVNVKQMTLFSTLPTVHCVVELN